MSKEEILKNCSEYYPAAIATNEALKAMDEYAKQRAIGFFIWYGVKVVGFLAYIKDIRPIVTSNEIEEKIAEFEGQSLDTLYSLYLKSKENETDK